MVFLDGGSFMSRKMQSCRGCSEYRTLTRRRFMEQARAAVGRAVTTPVWLPRVVLAGDENTDRDTLVVVFLYGAMDGLTSVVPYGDPNLYSPTLRPTLVVPPPGETNGAVDLDGFFGLRVSERPVGDRPCHRVA